MRKSTKTSFGQYPDSVFKKQMSASWVRSRDSEDLHPQMVKQARSSRQLNLSGRGLVSVPDKVSLSLVQTDHVAWIQTSHWSRLICVFTKYCQAQGHLSRPTWNLKPRRWPWDREWVDPPTNPPPINRSCDLNILFCQGLEPDGVWWGGEQTDDGWGQYYYYWPITEQYSDNWPITGEHGQRELRQLVGHRGPDQAHPRLQQDLLHITKGHKEYKFAKSLYLDQHFRNHFNYL